MSKQDVKNGLDGLAREAVPEGMNLWPGVRARVAQRAGAMRAPLRRARMAWAGLAVASLLVLGATAYAAAPVISKLLTMDDHFKTADAERLGQSLALSQTRGDVTATVQWAYADGQRVLVAYSIKTADGRRFDPGSATLTDSAGGALHATGGYGVTGHSDILDVSLPPGEGTYITTYDSPASADQAATLSLHLSLTTAEYALPSAATPAAVVNGNNTTVEAQPAVLLATEEPFEFDFEVPVVHGQ